MSQPTLIELTQTLGVPVALLVAILVMGARGMWVFGRQYEELAKRATRYEDMALAFLQTNDTAIKVIEKTTAAAERSVEIAAAKAVEAAAKTVQLEAKIEQLSSKLDLWRGGGP